MKIGDVELLHLCEERELVSPFDNKRLNPASYNFRLDNKIIRIDQTLDTKSLDKYDHPMIEIPETGILLEPGKLYLGSTVEKLKLPKDIGAYADGRSSTGRIGMFVHVTAGWCDPGFCGSVTLEIVTTVPLIIYPNMECGQFIFERTTLSTGYKGRYQNQESRPIPSRGGFYRN